MLSSAAVIWGFGVPGSECILCDRFRIAWIKLQYPVALNTARDLGARLMAMTYWGTAGSSLEL